MRPYTKLGKGTQIFSISSQLMGMKIGGWLAIFMKDLHLGTDSLSNSHAEGSFYKKNPKMQWIILMRLLKTLTHELGLAFWTPLIGLELTLPLLVEVFSS